MVKKKITKKQTKKVIQKTRMELFIEQFDWKKFVLGMKRPVITLLGSLILMAGQNPYIAFLGGLSAERIWATIEFILRK